MSIRKFFGDLASRGRTPEYRVIRSSIPITSTPEKSTREKIIELFNQYSRHECVFDARYIGSHKIHDPKDMQLVHLAIDLVRDGKRSMGGRKRPVELRMRLGNGVSVFDEGGATLKLRFPVYKLVYASKAPDNKNVFVFICDVSSKEKKSYRMYAFKSDEKTADHVIVTLKEMYYVVHKIHRAKKRKKRELEKRKSEVPVFDSELASATQPPRPLSSYLSEQALDESQVVFPTTFGASDTRVTAELDSMIEELSIESKALETATLRTATNPFTPTESPLFSFDDNFSEAISSPEVRANNRVSFYDAFSCNSVDNVANCEPNPGATTPSIDEEFISIAKRNIIGANNSGSRSNSFTKLFQKERSNSYSKINSDFPPISTENGTGTEETTLANPFSELTPPKKEKIQTPNT